MKQEHIVEYIVEGDDLIYNDDHGRLVRCKDCKFSCPLTDYVEWVKGSVACHCHGCVRQGDWFCADGREKEWLNT